MLLIVKEGIRREICHVIHQYTKANNKYMKHYDKEWLYFEYWDVNNLYGRAMSKRFPVNDSKWVKDISEFNEDFIKKL